MNTCILVIGALLATTLTHRDPRVQPDSLIRAGRGLGGPFFADNRLLALAACSQKSVRGSPLTLLDGRCDLTSHVG